MLLSNFVNYLFNGFRQSSYITRQQKAVNGNSVSYNMSNYVNKPYVVIGTGETEPQLSDYALESYVNLTKVSQSINVSADTKRLISCTTTYQNNTESPVTIKEVGMQWYFDSTSYPDLLCARSILETPITIGVGESYAFTYEIAIA